MPLLAGVQVVWHWCRQPNNALERTPCLRARVSASIAQRSAAQTREINEQLDHIRPRRARDQSTSNWNSRLQRLERAGVAVMRWVILVFANVLEVGKANRAKLGGFEAPADRVKAREKTDKSLADLETFLANRQQDGQAKNSDPLDLAPSVAKLEAAWKPPLRWATVPTATGAQCSSRLPRHLATCWSRWATTPIWYLTPISTVFTWSMRWCGPCRLRPKR